MGSKFVSEYDATIPVRIEDETATLHLYCARLPRTRIEIVDIYLDHSGGREHLGLRYDGRTERVLPFDTSDTDLLQDATPRLAQVLRQKFEQIEGVMQPKVLMELLETYIAFSELDGSNSN